MAQKKALNSASGDLKCSHNTKKNKKTLKVSFKAIFNINFANLVSKDYFSIQRLIIFLLYEYLISLMGSVVFGFLASYDA